MAKSDIRFSSSKLSFELIEKLTRCFLNNETGQVSSCTQTEINLVMYLASIQNCFGQVRDLYYKDVCQDLSISKQSFYNAINSLCEKEIIIVDWSHDREGVWTITFVNNIFANSEDDKKGYLPVNHGFFHNSYFRALKANEQRLSIKIVKYFLQIDHYNNKHQSENKCILTLKKMSEWTGVSERVIHNYLESLSEFISFDYVNDAKNTIIVNSIIDREVRKSDNDYYLIYRITTFCRRFNIPYTIDEVYELIKTFHHRKFKEYGLFVTKLCETIAYYGHLSVKIINGAISKTIRAANKKEFMKKQASKKNTPEQKKPTSTKSTSQNTSYQKPSKFCNYKSRDWNFDILEKLEQLKQALELGEEIDQELYEELLRAATQE